MSEVSAVEPFDELLDYCHDTVQYNYNLGNLEEMKRALLGGERNKYNDFVYVAREGKYDPTRQLQANALVEAIDANIVWARFSDISDIADITEDSKILQKICDQEPVEDLTTEQRFACFVTLTPEQQANFMQEAK